MSKVKSRLVLVTAVLIVGGVPVSSQQNVGRILGTISDSSGAVVPGAKVMVTDTATALRQEMLTNQAGAYSFSDLPIGTYSLTVGLVGFQNYDRSNIVVISGQSVTIDVKLVVGSASQTAFNIRSFCSALHRRNLN